MVCNSTAATSIRKYFYVLMLMFCMLGMYFMWECFFHKNFDEKTPSVALAGKFESRKNAKFMKNYLGLSKSDFKESVIANSSNEIFEKHIDVPRFDLFEESGRLVLIFINDELESLIFEPLNMKSFSEKLYEVFQFPKDAKDIEQFFISKNQYMYKRFKRREGDKVYFVWVDQNMRKKYLWLMRRYGSD